MRGYQGIPKFTFGSSKIIINNKNCYRCCEAKILFVNPTI